DPVEAGLAGVGQFESRDAGLDRVVLERTIPLLLREKVPPVGYDETHVASAGLVHPREINFIQNPVADREPHLAVLVEGGAYAGFGAGGPSWRNARPAGGIFFVRIAH